VIKAYNIILFLVSEIFYNIFLLLYIWEYFSHYLQLLLIISSYVSINFYDIVLSLLTSYHEHH
jgi:hypothetical protein